MIIRLPAPTTLHGNNLAAEIAAEIGVPSEQVSVTLNQGEVEILVPDGSARASVEQAVAAHTGTPTAEQQAGMDRRERLRAFRDQQRSGGLIDPAATVSALADLIDETLR